MKLSPSNQLETKARNEKCFMSRCRNDSYLYYYNVQLCDEHWTALCELSTREVKRILHIKQ